MKTLLCILVTALAASAYAAEGIESIPFIDRPLEYWRSHILLANASHAAGGFGLALVLQRQLAGKPGMKTLGWLLLAFTLITHVIAWV